jgi:hypothetical protein
MLSLSKTTGFNLSLHKKLLEAKEQLERDVYANFSSVVDELESLKSRVSTLEGKN